MKEEERETALAEHLLHTVPIPNSVHLTQAPKSSAFCCISTGEFRFPNQMAAEIAVRTVKDYLTEHPDCSAKQVVFNVFKDVDKGIYQQIL